MEVILLEDVKSLGKKGQIVKINDGYARNFVLPKKLGLEATPKNLNDLKLKKANEDKIAKEKLEAAKEFAKVLEESTVVVKIKSEKVAELSVLYLQRKLHRKQRNSWILILIKRKSYWTSQSVHWVHM